MTPDPIELGKFIILLAALAGMYVKITAALRQAAGKGELREISPNPLNVRDTPRAATMEDMAQLERRLIALERRFEIHLDANTNELKEVRSQLEDLRDRFDDKLDGHAEVLRGYSETLRAIERSLGRLENN